MDKKQLLKKIQPEDAKGFEEFIEGEPENTSFLPKPPANTTKKEFSFEHFTYLTNDGERLLRIKNTLTEKIPFTANFDQGVKLLADQEAEIKTIKKRIFMISDDEESPFRRSIGDIFDAFFGPIPIE